MDKQRKDRLEELTLDMVAIESVSETDGEDKCAEYIYDYLAGLPYFDENPQDLELMALPNDPHKRHNVVAVVRGKQASKKAVVLLGHIDTVEVDDYGDLKELACDPHRLADAFKERELPEEVKEDLDSGEYLFGRGVFDMKSGVAAQMMLLADVSRRADELNGSIVFLAVPDEENDSAGMLAAVERLNRFTEEDGFEFTTAVDSDYTAPRYPGDENQYVYVGTVGKLLPSFLVVGKETHVGEPFGGLDPNQLASEITSRINCSMDLCDGAEDEYPSLPVSLRQKDSKQKYSVQTAGAVQLYFNFATHQSTPDIVLEKMVAIAEDSFDSVLDSLNKEYRAYCEASGFPYKKLPWQKKVVTAAALYQNLKEKQGSAFVKHMEDFSQDLLKESQLDGRDYGMKVVEEMLRLRTVKDPVIVVFFLPPYYPHVYVKGDSEREKHVLNCLADTVKEAEKETGKKVVLKKFYPYISDLSYFSTSQKEEAIKALTENMPGWGSKYSLPLAGIRKLDLPVVNIGPMGKDAHQYTERLHKEYAFTMVPFLLEKMVNKLLGD